MKPVDVKTNTYIDSNKEINDKNAKFKVGDNSLNSWIDKKKRHSKNESIFPRTKVFRKKSES